MRRLTADEATLRKTSPPIPATLDDFYLPFPFRPPSRDRFLNVKAADKTDDEDLAAFLRYVNGQKPDSSFTKKLDEEATRIKNNDDWRLKAMTLDMEIQDMKKRIAKREREKGKQEGKHESKIEIAKKMLDDGMDISKVAKLTNLSVKEVTALA